MTCNSALSACAAVALWRWSLELYRCLQSHLVVWWNPLGFYGRIVQDVGGMEKSRLNLTIFIESVSTLKKNIGRLYLYLAIWGSVSPTVAWNEFEDMLDFLYQLKFSIEQSWVMQRPRCIWGGYRQCCAERMPEISVMDDFSKELFSFQMSFKKCRNHRVADTTGQYFWQSCCISYQ